MPSVSHIRFANWTLALLILSRVPGAVAQYAAMETELPQGLSADHLAVGSVVILRVRSTWDRVDCHIAPGALLHANVQHLTRKPDGHTRAFTFTVDAPCGDKPPVPLVLTSLLAPPDIETVTEAFPGFNSFGGAASASAGTSAPLNFNAGNAMRSAPLAFSSAVVETGKLPKSVVPGEVWRLPGVELVLPSTGGTISTVTSSRRSFHLPENTLCILQTSADDGRRLRTVAMNVVRSGPVSNVPVHAFVGPCLADRCTELPPLRKPSAFGSQHLGPDEDLDAFGFMPEHDHEVSELGRSVSVHFLGEREVLVTFPTHTLVKRTGDERPTDDPQAIRAVLFNTQTMSVERIENWIVDDHNTYVWPIGGNLLVHVEHELRILGQGMEQIATLPMALPLESLHISPDGERLVIGEIHELHTSEDHERLVETYRRGPQEEVLWSVLDGHLHRTQTLGTSSNFLPAPTLLNEGMIELRKGRVSEWFLVEKTWNSSGEKQLGGLRSSCLPVLDSLSRDLLTVSICDTSGDAMQTYLLHSDGSPVIDQRSDFNDLPISFAASSAATKIALMLTRASNDYARGLLFHLSVIRTQAIEVFDITNGLPMAQIPILRSAPFGQAFALSPSGSTLALLSGDDLELYSLQP